MTQGKNEMLVRTAYRIQRERIPCMFCSWYPVIWDSQHYSEKRRCESCRSGAQAEFRMRADIEDYDYNQLLEAVERKIDAKAEHAAWLAVHEGETVRIDPGEYRK